MAERVQLRPEQEAIVSGYNGGKVGVAAVPGSGKTFTLSHLAARLVVTLARETPLGFDDDREVLIVTFTNSGVNSFRARIDRILREQYGVDRKSTRLNSSHVKISYAVFCLKKKKNI